MANEATIKVLTELVSITENNIQQLIAKRDAIRQANRFGNRVYIIQVNDVYVVGCDAQGRSELAQPVKAYLFPNKKRALQVAGDLTFTGHDGKPFKAKGVEQASKFIDGLLDEAVNQLAQYKQQLEENQG